LRLFKNLPLKGDQGAELHLGVEADLDLGKISRVKRGEETLTSRS
jgi:hypothetical protein